jgi:protein-S-isoprenylcysteine O-methyltransferase Ste14
VKDIPALALTIVVWTYWFCVGVMILRVRRKTRKLAGIVPDQPLERLMGLVWVPLVALWTVLPWLAQTRVQGLLGLPSFALAGSYAVARWVAVAVAVACLLLSIRSWLQMGRDWRMAVTQDNTGKLFTEGMFGRVRHPIYSLSILLMLCSVLIVPTLPMLGVALVHVLLMVVKARNEERFLLGVHGEKYARYCEQTGRFVPRLRTRGR